MSQQYPDSEPAATGSSAPDSTGSSPTPGAGLPQDSAAGEPTSQSQGAYPPGAYPPAAAYPSQGAYPQPPSVATGPAPAQPLPPPPLPGTALPPGAASAGGWDPRSGSDVSAVGPTPLTAQQEKTWGMLSHVVPLVAMVLSAGTLGFVGSLVIYLMYRERGPFVRAHAANSLNIQIITGIALLISFPLMLLIVGFFTYAFALVFAFVLHVLGAIQANNGEWWNPPLTPRFVK